MKHGKYIAMIYYVIDRHWTFSSQDVPCGVVLEIKRERGTYLPCECNFFMLFEMLCSVDSQMCM